MAKRATAADAARKSNGFDGDKLKSYLTKLDELDAEIESSKGAHMNRCQKIRGSMDVVYEEAKALGIPKKVLKAHHQLRKLEVRKSAVVDKLSDDDVETFEAVSDALGDFAQLPLGAAAVQRAEASDADRAALDSLN